MLVPAAPRVPRPPGRVRRALAATLSTLGLGAVFVTSALFAIGLHLGLAPTRRLILLNVNEGLSTTFAGKIIADEIERASLSGVDIRSAIVVDAHGVQVIRASGIHARADVLWLARRVVFSGGPVTVDLPFVRIDDAEVLVERAPDAALPSIAEAFLPRTPSPARPGARGVRVDLGRIEIGHVWAHGKIAGPRELDADVSRVIGALHLGAQGLALDVDQTGITERSLIGPRVSGSANYHLRVSAEGISGPGPGTSKMWTDFVGQLGAIEVQARGTLEGTRLTATAVVPRATPEQLASVIPDVPIHEALSATLDATGDLPTLSISGAVSFDGAQGPRGTAEIEGRLDVGSTPRIEADVAAHAIDPAVFAPVTGSPVDVAGRVRIEIGDVLRFQTDASTTPFVLVDQLIPAADVHLVFDRGALSGNATLHEEGAPIDATFALSPDRALTFVATSDVASLRAIPRLALPLGGAARVRVAGTLRAGVIDARVGALYSGLTAPGGVAVGYGGLEGHLQGSLAAPDDIDLDATAWGRKATGGGYAFDRLDARAHGPILHPALTAKLLTNPARDGQSDDDPTADGLTASGTLDPKNAGIRDVNVRLRRDGTEVSGKVARIGSAPGGVALEGVALEGQGVGRITGGLTVRDREIVGKLRGEGVDLERAGKLARFGVRLRGLADFDVDLRSTAHGRKGHVAVQLENGEVSLLTGVSAQLTATFDDDKVTADGLVRLVAHAPPKGGDREPCSGTIAALRVTDGEGELPGHLLEPASLARLNGKARIAADDWDLRCLARLAPVGLFLSDLRGKLTTRLAVERQRGERFVSIHDLVARTTGLEVAGPQALGADAPAWESRKIDVQLKGDLDGVTGDSTLRGTLFDGEVVTDASLATTLDLAALVDRPKDRWATLRRARLAGRVSIPRRPVASFVTLPTFVRDRLPALSGEISADAYVDGTIDQPFFTARASAFKLATARRLESGEATPWSVPLDLEALATYDAEKATLDLHVKHEGKDVAEANGEVAFDLHKLLAGIETTYTAGFYAKLTEVPIGGVPWFSDHDVGGHVNGTLAMSGLHERPELKIDLTIPDLKVGQDLFFNEGSLKLDTTTPTGASADRATARVQAHLAAEDGGLLDASAFAGILWQGGLIPTIDAETAADFYAKAQSLRLAVFHPAVADILSKLDGYLDGDLRVGWKRLAAGDRANIDAKLKVKSGVVHVPQIGQELHDVTVDIASKPDGTIELADIRADGTRGRITGSARAHLDGLRFERADGAFTIRRGEEIPLTLEGVPIGNARGTINITAAKTDSHIRANLSIPQLHLDLPAETARGVQPLDDNPHVTVSHAVGAPKESRAEDALAWTLIFDLGRVDVTGTNLDVAVSGSKTSPPTVELTDQARVSGDIELLPGGVLQFFGKEFVVEQAGLIRLRSEDTSNPYLNVKARWRGAPAGTNIFVQYIGVLQPITPEKLKFIAEPAMPEGQILSMLLGAGDSYGTLAGGVQTGPGPSAQQFAGGVAVQVASSQVSALLSGTVFKGFSPQFTTNEDGTLRPGLGYAIGDKLHVTASYENATSGTNGSSTIGGAANARTTGRTVITGDWRFLPTWVLRGTATVGGEQPSTGVDIVWQYRY